MWRTSLRSTVLLTWSGTSDNAAGYKTWRLGHKSDRSPSSARGVITSFGGTGDASNFSGLGTCTLTSNTTLQSRIYYCNAQPNATRATSMEGEDYRSNSPPPRNSARLTGSSRPLITWSPFPPPWSVSLHPSVCPPNPSGWLTSRQPSAATHATTTTWQGASPRT